MIASFDASSSLSFSFSGLLLILNASQICEMIASSMRHLSHGSIHVRSKWSLLESCSGRVFMGKHSCGQKFDDQFPSSESHIEKCLLELDVLIAWRKKNNDSLGRRTIYITYLLQAGLNLTSKHCHQHLGSFLQVLYPVYVQAFCVPS